MDAFDCDYVVVGSGAGGGTLAARLAEAGRSVVLLEAGGDVLDQPGGARLPADYDVPAFHPFAAENPAMRWDYFVRHFQSDAQARRDPKYVAAEGGIYYPRAGTLGGCTAHNAMILVRPHDQDWDAIAALTGDASWRAVRMERYFRLLEDCRYRPLWRGLARLGIDPSGHGWSGWLSSEHALPHSVFSDRQLLSTIVRTTLALGAQARHVAGLLRRGLRRLPSEVVDVLQDLGRLGLLERLGWQVDDPLDPNDRRRAHLNRVGGLCYTPLATRGHRRTGTRERVRAVQESCPGKLRIELHALATRVVLDGTRAVGVEYLSGERLYSAHPEPNGAAGDLRQVRASREVILAGGAFNTPQLLMLSGIGPLEELARHGIACAVPLDGVGRNLQDRYEVGVISRMAANWGALEGAEFKAGDALFGEWRDRQDGMYISNGAVMAVERRSAPAQPVPDLFCMLLLARFAGYVPGYSDDVARHHDRMTWAVLKAHTRNRAGRVTLRSADPRDRPEIQFNYFEDGSDAEGEDLRAVVAAIRFVRTLTGPLREAGLIVEEEMPGAHVESDAELSDFVRANAWGHHASCTCAIGPREAGGVLDGDFSVHGTTGLRVVDASVFPRIPGTFIVSAVYMIAEKAAEVILRDAASQGAPAPAR